MKAGTKVKVEDYKGPYKSDWSLFVDDLLGNSEIVLTKSSLPTIVAEMISRGLTVFLKDGERLVWEFVDSKGFLYYHSAEEGDIIRKAAGIVTTQNKFRVVGNVKERAKRHNLNQKA